MAEYWFEYDNREPSVKRSSLSELRQVTNHIISEPKLLNIEGDDIDLKYLFTKTNIPLCFINFTNDFIWEDSFNTIVKDICLKNCNIKDLRLSNLRLNELQIIESKISNILFSSVNIDVLFEISDNSKIEDFQFKESNFRSFKLKKSILKKLNSLGGGFNEFTFENVRIDRLSLIGGHINIFKIAESNDYIGMFFMDLRIENFQIYSCKKLDLHFTSCLICSTVNILDSSGKILFEQLKDNSTKSEFYFQENYNCQIIISKCDFTYEVSFTGQNYESNKNIELRDSVFRELVLFNENNSLGLIIDKVLFQKGVYIPINTKNLNVQSANKTHSSVWCTLKNQALARNDKISALELSRYEMESYASELKGKKDKWHERFFYKWQERIVLWLNKTSNRHGLSWGRGVYFTLKCWLAFFILFYMACDNFNGLNWYNSELIFFKKDFWDKAFQFLWLPQGVTMLSDGFKNNVNAVSFVLIVVSFFFGKIFIGYGIFQTISAFRKHGTSK